jgi:hypothetical protein
MQDINLMVEFLGIHIVAQKSCISGPDVYLQHNHPACTTYTSNSMVCSLSSLLDAPHTSPTMHLYLRYLFQHQRQ